MRRAARPGTALARVALATVVTGPALCLAAGAAHADDSRSSETRGPSFSLIDNSHADSWLEVDRTANSTVGSGTAGSDHDGGDEVRHVIPRIAGG